MLFADLFVIHATGVLQGILYVTIIVLLVFMVWSPEAREAHNRFLGLIEQECGGR